MSTVPQTSGTPTPGAVHRPRRARRRFRFTLADVFRLQDQGWFREQRVELIDGDILVMAAQKNLHAAAIALANDALSVAFGPGFWVRNQNTLDLAPQSAPDPDLAVVPGSPRGASPDNPTSALLVVEVSDSTLKFDRGRKANLYAATGILDYWIINLVDGQLEVRRHPVADAKQRFGYRYDDVTLLKPGDFATPLAAPQARIAVADLLP